MSIIQGFLIMSGVAFWLLLLFITILYLKELYDEWRLKRIFRKYNEKIDKTQKGE